MLHPLEKGLWAKDKIGNEKIHDKYRMEYLKEHVIVLKETLKMVCLGLYIVRTN